MRASRSFVYGPLPSRRLGRSLGVDLLPFKTCTYNCVYCQLGRTKRLQAEREDFYPLEDVWAQLSPALGEGGYDFVSFVGAGEPTLYRSLGTLIRRSIKEGARVAVITNGSLLWRDDVLEDIALAHIVVPSLDAGRPETFRRINRAHKAIGFEGLLKGLESLANETEAQVWLEVMLVAGLNDSDEELFALAEHINRIKPSRVHLNLPVRPPCEAWVKIPPKERIKRAEEVLGAQVLEPHLVEAVPDAETLEEAIAETVLRHPMTIRELSSLLSEKWPRDEIIKAVERMRSGGQIGSVQKDGEEFYTPPEGRYG